MSATPVRHDRSTVASYATAAALLGALAVAAVALWPHEADTRFASSRSGGVVGAQALAAPGCAEDPADDEVIENETETADFPKADLLEVCLIEGDTVDLSVRVAEVSDPNTDPNWDDAATFAAWGLDTNEDGAQDTTVVFGIEASGVLEGVVVDDASGTERCADLIARVDSDRYLVEDIPRNTCLGQSTTLAVAASMFYASDAADSSQPVYVDHAPDSGFLTPPPTDTSTEPGDNSTEPGGSSTEPGGNSTEPDGNATEPDGNATEPGGPPTTERLAGASRIDTAIAISAARFPDGAPVVYLARADVLADAVAAGTLPDGPILLVPTCGELPPSVAAEIARLGPDRVVGLGGPDAICDSMLAGAADGRPTSRLAGSGRVETSVAISQAVFAQRAAEVYLARADVFADAVAGGTLTRGPILLVPTCGDVPAAVAAEIDRLAPGRVLALGGSAAVCDTLLLSAADGGQSGRLAGDDRFATAVAISVAQFPQGADSAYLARSDVFADAVTAGSLIDGPVLLVPPCDGVPETVGTELDRLNPERVVALGGVEAVCQATLDEAAGR